MVFSFLPPTLEETHELRYIKVLTPIAVHWFFRACLRRVKTVTAGRGIIYRAPKFLLLLRYLSLSRNLGLHLYLLNLSPYES